MLKRTNSELKPEEKDDTVTEVVLYLTKRFFI